MAQKAAKDAQHIKRVCRSEDFSLNDQASIMSEKSIWSSERKEIQIWSSCW